jgi:hypothetical protein
MFKSPNPTFFTIKMPRAKKSNVELLEKEITLLGGTKDDLQLIAGIDEGEAEFEVYNVCEH